MRRTTPPDKNPQFDLIFFTDEMPFLGKQVLLLDTKNLREKFDLLTSGDATQRLDVGDLLPRHVDVA